MALASGLASAQNYASTNIQILYGRGFHDNYYGYSTPSGQLTTLTLEHYSTWAYGDNYAFVDMLFGKLLDFSNTPVGSTVGAYAEWTPRLSLNKLAKKKPRGLIGDIYAAAEFDFGRDFHAENVGASADLNVPGFTSLGISLFRRTDHINKPTFQATAFWCKPIGSDRTPLTFSGYVDVAGTDHDGLDINGQPQLLWDISRGMHLKPNELSIGIEWYYHHNRNMTSSVPQILAKWSF